MTLAAIVGGKGTLTVVAGSRSYTAAVDHPNYKRVVEALKEANTPAKEKRVIKLLDVPYVLNKFTKGVAELRNGEVYFNGEPLHTDMTRRILEHMNAGLPFAPMLRFLENVSMNPSARSREELYKFLEHRALPLTDDGCFLGYKKVRDNFYDWHSGKFNNAVGQKHSMPRENVDPDCAQHCSTGFHVGTIEYATSFYSNQGKMVIVKVNPVNAVSVPNDCSCQKIRVCEYEVVAEYISDLEKPVYNGGAGDYVPSAQDVADDGDFADEVPVYDAASSDVDDAPVVKPRSEKAKAAKAKNVEEVAYHNKRDSSGRFAPKKRVR